MLVVVEHPGVQVDLGERVHQRGDRAVALTADLTLDAVVDDAIAEVAKRTKDEGYKTRLGAYPVPRLWDMFQSATKRARSIEKKQQPKKAAAPKAKAEATPKKKAAASKTAKKKA